MPQNEMLYLSQSDVETVGLTMTEIITSLEAVFREKAEGAVQMPPKPGVHPREDAFIHAMPAYVPSVDAAGIKWVSGYPANRARGLPYISGLIILNDPDTGLPTAVMDAAWITGMRTGAATAVAAKYLARRAASTVGIIACGLQGRRNLEALASVFRLTRVRAYDLVPEAANALAGELAPALGLEIEVVTHPRDAVVGLDLVVTSGPILKDPAPVIEPDWLSPGGFACALDFDSYWKGDALNQADKLATDDSRQLEYYRAVGYFRDTPQPYADLGEIVSGQEPGRQTDEERIICINLGLALADMITAQAVVGRAKAMGIGRWLPL